MQEHKPLTRQVKRVRNALEKKAPPVVRNRAVEAKGLAEADQITEGERVYHGFGLYHNHRLHGWWQFRLLDGKA